LIRGNDFCLTFRPDEGVAERLRAAGADDQLISGLREVAVCWEERRAEEEPARRTEEEASPSSGTQLYSPSSAALRSLAIPGLGQFYTGSPAAGGLFLAGWAGALGFGLMSQEVTIECLAKTTGSCPPGDVRDEIVRRPKLMIGLGAAAVLAVASALHARSAANKANSQTFSSQEDARTARVRLHVLPVGQPLRATDIVLVQLRF